MVIEIILLSSSVMVPIEAADILSVEVVILAVSRDPDIECARAGRESLPGGTAKRR